MGIVLNNLAALLRATNRLVEAEPLMRRALAIDEGSFGADHPKIAIRLNNLALLLQVTNRLAEAESLYRRGLLILTAFQRQTGYEHPNFDIGRANYVAHLRKMGRTEEQTGQHLRELMEVPQSNSS